MVEEGRDEVAKSTFYEILKPDSTVHSNLQSRIFDTTRSIAQELAVTPAGTVIRENKLQNNVFHLGPGNHLKTTISKQGTVIKGIIGAYFSGLLTVNEDASLNASGIRFDKGATIKGTSTVIFTDCVFEAPVSMENGAKAHFIGCQFIDEGNVNNAGAAANAYIIGCSRTSGVANVNVTVIAETT